MELRVFIVSSDFSLCERLGRSLGLGQIRSRMAEAVCFPSVRGCDPPSLVVFDQRDLSTSDAMIRAWTLHCPVLVLIATPSESEEIRLLQLGVGSVLCRSSSIALITAHVQALLATVDVGRHQDFLRVGPLLLDRQTHQLDCNGVPIALRRVEFALLSAFMSRPHHVLERESLMRAIWHGEGTDRALESAASRIRRGVLESGGPRIILPVRSVGYRLGLAGRSRG